MVKTVVFSRHGPLVDSILPSPADRLGPVSLQWLGMHAGGWLTALLAMNRANTVQEFRAALRPWHVPTFSMVFADVQGDIGFHAAGRIPVRTRPERGFRRGWDPEDQWQGLIPFEEMPAVDNPARGWIATANNRVAADDFPHPLAGTWSSGWRGLRIRQWFEQHPRLAESHFGSMHQDAVSLRAATSVPDLLGALEGAVGEAPGAMERGAKVRVAPGDAVWNEALRVLESWDYRVEPASVAATVFNVFFTNWCRRVAQARFDAETAEFLMKGIDGCAARLLRDDPAGWWEAGERLAGIRAAFLETLEYLAERFGGELSQWSWGKLHRMPLRHVLSGRGELGTLLDHGGVAVSGDMNTVGNTGSGPDWSATTGGGYRMIADLGSAPPRLLAVDAQSQSGHPGSPHYSDQLEDWLAGRYHELPLVRAPQSDWIQQILSPA